MEQTALAPSGLTRTAVRLNGRVFKLVALAVLILSGGLFVDQPLIALAMAGAGASILCLAAVVSFLATRYHRARRRVEATIAGFVANDFSPCFTTDADGRIGYRNRAALERFGQGDAETLIATLGDSFASPAAVLHRLQVRASAKGAAREDVVLRRGQLRLTVHQIGRDGFLWRMEDISDRGSPGRGADTLALPMLTASRSGTILFVNDALRRLTGRRDQALDQLFNDLPLRPGKVHEIAAEDGPMRVRVAQIVSPAGRREIYLMPAGQENDASEWSLAEDFPVPMLQLARDGRILLANRTARDLLGSAGLVDRLLGELVEGLGRSLTDWLAEAAAGEVPKPEVVRVKRDDHEVFVQIRLGRVEDKRGVTLVAVLTDATELKTLEAQFVQSQKMQAIGQLAGGVAHDFNNLLTAISGHCDLLLLRHDTADQDYSDLIQIHQNANRAASLVGQLLAFSRKQNLQPQILDLTETLSDHSHLLNRLVGEKVVLEVRHGADLPTIRADRRQLEQVMMNLVVNARDAMPAGGTIRVTTGHQTLATPLSRDRAVVPAGDYVVITVADEGTGIAEDKLGKIFEPFYTTKKTGEGTGLGLSTAYGIVKQSGGFIFVDSEVGKGTVFTLYFPVHLAPKAAAAQPQPQPDLPRPTHRAEGGVVLLVEDEAPVRAFASRALRMRGFTVIEAEDAEAALATLEDHDLSVDVFVTDVIMPGMDGPSWVAKALEQRPGVKVVFVSGYAEESIADQQARIPNAVFLPKPFSLSELTSTVANQLH